MIKGFLKEAKKYFGRNLAGIVLYGSRIWGFSNKKSDYDLFIFLRKKVNKKKILKHFKKYKKISLAYILTFPELKRKIRNGSWASYLALLKASKILYRTENYDKILNWLRKHKINKKKIKENYLKRKQSEIGNAKKCKGFKATKWITISIGKRLQILTYFRFNLLEPKFLRNLERNKNVLKIEEYNLAKKLYKKIMTRRKIGEDKKKAIDLLKKVDWLCKKVYNRKHSYLSNYNLN